MKNRLRNEAGMTLIEILIVLAILGSVAGMFVYNFIGGQDEANVRQTKIIMSQISQAIKAFKADSGFYPTSDQGLQALIEKPTTGRIPKSYPADGYLEDLPTDKWDGEFVYKYPGENCKFEIISFGPDAEEGTEDDISSCTKNAAEE